MLKLSSPLLYFKQISISEHLLTIKCKIVKKTVCEIGEYCDIGSSCIKLVILKSNIEILPKEYH